MTDDGRQTTAATQPAGFWKIRHAVIGFGVLLVVIIALRSCGEEAGEEQVEVESDDAKPRQAVVVQIPATPQGLPQHPVAPQPYQQPAYPQQQQPVYGYPAQQQPVYPQQQQPVYGYPAQQQSQFPTTSPDNPWAVQQQPAYSYGSQPAPSAQQWGQTQRQQPLYTQPPGTGQYRPLEESRRSVDRGRVQQPAPVQQSYQPYDRLGGSSYGATGGYPATGTYPGYYGGTTYGAPAAPYGWPGSTGYGGVPWPRY